jgi:hypothetical protein
METLRLPSKNIERFAPAPPAQIDWLRQQYSGFFLSEYLALLQETNGLGQVFEEGEHRFVHNMLVLSAEEALEVSEAEFGCRALAVGRLGIDGVTFVLQASSPAVFAYIPIEEEFRQVASSLQELLDKCAANDLRV